MRLFDKSGGHLHKYDVDTWCFNYEQLNDFANMITKKEREACAKICETLWDFPENGMATEEECYGAQCAGAIRSRGIK
jgi:hypothetical protein